MALESILEIRIDSPAFSPEQLRDTLAEAIVANSASITFEVRPASSRLRSPVTDSSVVIAVLAGGAATLSALLTGLLKVVERRQDKAGKIVLKGSNGATVEVPAGTPAPAVAELIELAKRLDQPRITLKL